MYMLGWNGWKPELKSVVFRFSVYVCLIIWQKYLVMTKALEGRKNYS